ncbi:MAG TPA: hypothetical protein GXX49_11250 [Clostridiaceae bacterium]|nr:hypothetical protein [Clostridiaceae bacterium]
MKKTLVFMLTLAIIFTLAACGEKKTPAPAQNTPTTKANPTAQATAAPTPAAQATSTPTESKADSTGASENSNFSTKTFGYITISVPKDFSDVQDDWGDYYVSDGPDWTSVIEVSNGGAVEKRPEEWAKEELLEGLGDMLKDFKGEFDLNGNKAVYYTIYFETEGGEGTLQHLVWLYNADITTQYSICLRHDVNDKFFSSDVIDHIINSITLAPEAKHLAAGSGN